MAQATAATEALSASNNPGSDAQHESEKTDLINKHEAEKSDLVNKHEAQIQVHKEQSEKTEKALQVATKSNELM